MLVGSDHVIVVGGGVVGMSAALAFAERGVDVTLVAPRQHTLGSVRRMYSVHLGSERFLRDLGVWSQRISERSASYQSIMVWSDVPGQLVFDAQAQGLSHLGHMVDEADLLAAFGVSITQHQCIQTMDDTVVALDIESGRLQLSSGGWLQGDLVIGADGARSQMRSLGGYDFDEQPYGQTAIVATVGHEQSHQQQLIQRFLPGGPVALLALKDAHKSSLVWTLPEKEAKEWLVCEDRLFNEALTEAAQGLLGHCQLLGKRHGFPLVGRHISQYDKHQCVLLGDAAHTVHPLAGQGANMGWMDVRSLVDRVILSRQKGWGLADSGTLKQWGRDRHAENAKMLTVFGGLNRLFGNPSKKVDGFRQSGMAVLHRLPMLKSVIMRRACGLLD